MVKLVERKSNGTSQNGSVRFAMKELQKSDEQAEEMYIQETKILGN